MKTVLLILLGLALLFATLVIIYRSCVWNDTYDGCFKPKGRICPRPILEQKKKTQTNADRIRAMSDEELAEFLADRFAKETYERLGADYLVTATQIEAIRHTWYCCWMDWLKQPDRPAPKFNYEEGEQPHGAEQFEQACGVCMNMGTDLCRECKAEKKSGFRPPF